MFDLIARYMSWLYDLTNSFGGAIILVTISVMLITTPLTLSGTKSMMQMQRMQPELRKLQEKYKDDRETLNQEMLKFYQDNGINPVGGCLPMFVQLPVFFVLYRVVAGLTRRHVDLGDGAGWATGALASDTPASFDFDQNFNPEYLDATSSLSEALSNRNDMPFLGVDLARSLLDVIRDNFVDSLPYVAMIVLVLLTSLYQQRQIRGRSTGAAINPQQEMIMKVLPWMLPVFSFGFQAALVLYFIVSNVYRIGQQAYITHTMYGDNAPEPVAVGASASPSKSSPSKPGKQSGSKKKGSTSGSTKTSKSGRSSKDATKGGAAKSKSNGSTNRTGPRRGGGRTTPKKSASRASDQRTGPRREASIEPKPRKKKRK
ncbi:MAG: YidC/Oxa1 family membrane protein insertase [Acidimicrobiales bacterium]|nr:YidC/Oxa1 family membrane protein insertase [Acidimicrobiales bacterium]